MWTKLIVGVSLIIMVLFTVSVVAFGFLPDYFPQSDTNSSLIVTKKDDFNDFVTAIMDQNTPSSTDKNIPVITKPPVDLNKPVTVDQNVPKDQNTPADVNTITPTPTPTPTPPKTTTTTTKKKKVTRAS